MPICFGRFFEIKSEIEARKYTFINSLIDIKSQMEKLINVINIYRNNKKNMDEKIYDIGIIVTSDKNKNINGMLQRVSSLRDDINYCYFCYHADIAKKIFLENNKTAVSVESFFDIKYVLKDYFAFLRDARYILKKMKKSNGFFFQGIDVSQCVLFLFERSLKKEKYENILYERMVNSFLDKNKAYLLTGNGDTNFISNRIFYHVQKKKGLNILFYQNATGIDVINTVVEQNYEPNAWIMNLRFFLKSSGDLSVLRNNGWGGQVYFPENSLCGNLRTKSSFQKCKEERKPILLWAPSYPVRGHYSMNSFLQDNNYLINGIKDQECDLYIKYHPNQDKKLIKEYMKHPLKNVHVIEQEESIEKYIEISDVIITTPSLIMIDASIKNKPVICLAEKCGYELIKHFEEGFIIIRREMLNIKELVKICNDDDRYCEYFTRIVEKQKEFLLGMCNYGNESMYEVLKRIISETQNRYLSDEV